LEFSYRKADVVTTHTEEEARSQEKLLSLKGAYRGRTRKRDSGRADASLGKKYITAKRGKKRKGAVP